MNQKPFQDFYPDHFSQCYGCGRLNEQGLHIKSYWDGDETVCIFIPKEYHIAVPGFVYRGLIASIIDCHSIATAIAAICRAESREIDSAPPAKFVTGSLHVDYLKPVPINAPMELRSSIKTKTDRKVVVVTHLSSKGAHCATGEVVAVKVPGL